MLTARARLTASSSFKTAYSRGRSIVSDLIVVYVLPGPGENQVRFGFTAGKKVGGAVQRNRAKRLMRESARDLMSRIPGSFDIVVVARGKITCASYSDVRAQMESLLSRAGVLKPRT